MSTPWPCQLSLPTHGCNRLADGQSPGGKRNGAPVGMYVASSSPSSRTTMTGTSIHERPSLSSSRRRMTSPVRQRSIAASVGTCPGSGTGLRLSRDLGVLGERLCHDTFICSSSSAAFGAFSAVAVARVGSVVGAAGPGAYRSGASLSLSGSGTVFAASVFGGDLVRALHRYALVAGAVPGAGVAERRDVSSAVGGVAAARRVRAGDPGVAGATGRGGQVGDR